MRERIGLDGMGRLDGKGSFPHPLRAVTQAVVAASWLCLARLLLFAAAFEICH